METVTLVGFFETELVITPDMETTVCICAFVVTNIPHSIVTVIRIVLSDVTMIPVPDMIINYYLVQLTIFVMFPYKKLIACPMRNTNGYNNFITNSLWVSYTMVCVIVVPFIA